MLNVRIAVFLTIRHCVFNILYLNHYRTLATTICVTTWLRVV